MWHYAVSFRQQFDKTDYSSRCPVSQFWDENEPRLFVCETVPISSESSSYSFLEAVKVTLWCCCWSCTTESRKDFSIFLLRQTYQLWRFSVLKNMGSSSRTASLSPQACRRCLLWMCRTIISAVRWGQNTPSHLCTVCVHCGRARGGGPITEMFHCSSSLQLFLS